MENKYSPKKIDILSKMTLYFCQAYYRAKYFICYNSPEILMNNKDEPIVLLSKHQAFADLLLEGYFILSATKKSPCVPMKDSLPRFLEYLGGIPITRLKDIYSIINKEERKNLIKEAKIQKDFLEQAYFFHLSRNEPIILHPEGERNYKKVGKINRGSLALLLDVQEKLERPITFIPLDIFYEDLHSFRSKVILTPGIPIKTSSIDILTNHLLKYIQLLEN